jgi:Cu-Zn family superoxide dismutase
MRKAIALTCALAGAIILSTVAASAKQDDRDALRVALRTADGKNVGTVKLEAGGFNTLDVRAHTRPGIAPGWHGFHIHAVGRCEGPDFASAGPHLKSGAENHPDHAGDLAPLLVKANGRATGRLTTDRVTLEALRDADGSALVVHAGPDNFANIPGRYIQGGPDADSLTSGDSGARVACGVIAPSARVR